MSDTLSAEWEASLARQDRETRIELIAREKARKFRNDMIRETIPKWVFDSPLGGMTGKMYAPQMDAIGHMAGVIYREEKERLEKLP